MKPEIILSLLEAEQGFTSDIMSSRLLESKETLKTWRMLDALLTPLSNNALEVAVAYGSAKERDGFLNGFRVATRLMMESLWSVEGSET